jgi:hypothetical protein
MARIDELSEAVYKLTAKTPAAKPTPAKAARKVARKTPAKAASTPKPPKA